MGNWGAAVEVPDEKEISTGRRVEITGTLGVLTLA